MDIPEIGTSEAGIKAHQHTTTGSSETVRKRYTLDELLAQCDLNAPMVTEEEIWGDFRPVGKEIW